MVRFSWHTEDTQPVYNMAGPLGIQQKHSQYLAWSDLPVGDHVGLQIVFHVEALVAHGTLEWFLPCVNSHMVLQEEMTGEALRAVTAGKLAGFVGAWVPGYI